MTAYHNIDATSNTKTHCAQVQTNFIYFINEWDTKNPDVNKLHNFSQVHPFGSQCRAGYYFIVLTVGLCILTDFQYTSYSINQNVQEITYSFHQMKSKHFIKCKHISSAN